MIPFKPAEDLWSTVVPVLAAVLVGVAAAAFAAWQAKRRGWPLAGARQGRRLRVVERLMVSRRLALLLVELDGRTLLLGHSADRLSVLAAPDRPPHGTDETR